MVLSCDEVHAQQVWDTDRGKRTRNGAALRAKCPSTSGVECQQETHPSTNRDDVHGPKWMLAVMITREGKTMVLSAAVVVLRMTQSPPGRERILVPLSYTRQLVKQMLRRWDIFTLVKLGLLTSR